MIPRPAMVPVRLRDLRLAEEFQTSLTHQRGRVIDWGHVRDTDHTGRVTRVRAVMVRFGTVERIHSAELVVLVPFNRPHVRQDNDEQRWAALLREPFSAAKVRADESRRYGGLAAAGIA